MAGISLAAGVYKPRYLVKCLLVAVCIHHVVLMIPWPGLTPVRVVVWCTLLTGCLLNLVGEGGASYLRHSCPMGTALRCKQRCFQPTPSLLTGLRSSEVSSMPPALCSASCSTMTCSFFLRPSSSLLSLYLVRFLSPLFPFPLPSSDCLGLHLHIDICCICAFQQHCKCSSFQVFHHSLLTVTVVFCWGEFAWHSLTYVQLLTSQTCLLPCAVWVKRRDSVCHSTRRQPLLQLRRGKGSEEAMTLDAVRPGGGRMCGGDDMSICLSPRFPQLGLTLVRRSVLSSTVHGGQNHSLRRACRAIGDQGVHATYSVCHRPGCHRIANDGQTLKVIENVLYALNRT